MSRVDVERLGGLAGFGGPGSHLRSRGSVDSSQLSQSDRAAVEALFASPPKAGGPPDGFVYRLTRSTPKGPQSVEVADQHLPEAVKASVKDELV